MKNIKTKTLLAASAIMISSLFSSCANRKGIDYSYKDPCKLYGTFWKKWGKAANKHHRKQSRSRSVPVGEFMKLENKTVATVPLRPDTPQGPG